MNKASLPQVALIAGPTASGKSAAALALAEQHGGVVVNADASQVYRDLRVLTARPSPADEACASHRLFGHIDGADAGYSAARWAAEARVVIAEAQAAGRLPILVGGTGLYLRTLIEGIAPVPPIDPAVRAGVRALPVEEAYRALAEFDPAGAARLRPADSTRVARALEVVRSTGRPLSAWQATRTGGIGGVVDLAAVVLLPDRASLADRIERRAAAMLAEGAIAEVAALLARGDIAPDAPVRRAIGVAAVAEHLSGAITEEAVLHRIVGDTRRYAKRQYTWFRHQPPDTWSTAVSSNDALSNIVIRLRL